MHHVLLPVPPDLHAWVEGAAVLTFDGTDIVNRFPALLGGTLCVVLQGRLELPEGSGWCAVRGSLFSGPSSAPLVSRGVGPLRCLSASLRPAATSCMAGAGGMELRDAVVPLSDLWGPAWVDCEEAIRQAPTLWAGAELLFDFLRRRTRSDAAHERHGRIAALQRAAMFPLAAASAQWGWSERQFERVFTGHLGLGPKLFQRIARVHAALLDALMSGRRGAELALRHGYYDQAHLARDLRLLAGDPLTQLLAQAAQPVSEQWPLQLGKRWAGSATTARP